MRTRQLEWAVEAGDLVEAFRGFGLTQADLAQVSKDRPQDGVRVAPSTPGRATPPTTGWKGCARSSGRWPTASLHAASVSGCMPANRLLEGRRPLEVLQEGDQQAVLAAARSFVDGAYV